MENNKKQQNFSRSDNTKTSNSATDTSREKPQSDLQPKHCSKNSRRRENPQTSSRNKQQLQQLSSKARPNVDKRPRGRGCNGGSINSTGGGSSGFNDSAASSSRLVARESTTYAFSGEGALGRFESNNDDFYELYASGTKSKNLNHLLNFYYTPRQVDYYDGVGSGSNHNSSHGQRQGHVKKHKYNKEQFLQANFQFVIKASAKRKTDDSPDTLIDWSLIEQINIQTLEETQCPICLYPPVAAKVTRCGHVYCWPCVLHYLSLSDKTWRKCPICYDAVHANDLKSATIVQQQSFNVGSSITLRLMRRSKGSLLIEKCENMNKETSVEKYPYVSSPMEEKLFSKFILATRNDVADILARERFELLKDVDSTCPEFVFIQQALVSLTERLEKLGELDLKENPKQAKSVECCGENDDSISYKTGEPEEQLSNEEELAAGSTAIGEDENTEKSTTDTSCQQLTSSTTKYFYFYQADDGQNVYLHPLNVKMLQACYGCLANAPNFIEARIVQKEQHSMDEDHRRKFTYLGHLPLTCQYSVVEVELLPPYVTEDIIETFTADIIYRERERKRRAREERKREKHIDAINARQMGKLVASTANINISSSDDFPTWGFDDMLVANATTAENVPSTSKNNRKKTTSSSSAGSCSYSSIALNCQQEHSPWTTLNAKQNQCTKKADDLYSDSDEGELSVLNSIQTNLGDVLAQALSQKSNKKSKSTEEATETNTNKKKKSKKSKKMLPLFSTGMNFSGN